MEEVVHGNFRIRPVADSYFLIDMTDRGSDYRSPLELNELSARILEACWKGMEVAEITEAICREYDAKAADVEADVTAVLQRLSQYI